MQSRYGSVAHDGRLWRGVFHDPRVVISLGLLVAFIGSTGWFGDFVMLVSFGATVGTGVGAWTALIAEWRVRRRAPVSPWSDPRRVDSQRHMTIGAATGIALGTALGVLDLLVVSL